MRTLKVISFALTKEIQDEIFPEGKSSTQILNEKMVERMNLLNVLSMSWKSFLIDSRPSLKILNPPSSDFFRQRVLYYSRGFNTVLFISLV